MAVVVDHPHASSLATSSNATDPGEGLQRALRRRLVNPREPEDRKRRGGVGAVVLARDSELEGDRLELQPRTAFGAAASQSSKSTASSASEAYVV